MDNISFPIEYRSGNQLFRVTKEINLIKIEKCIRKKGITLWLSNSNNEYYWETIYFGFADPIEHALIFFKQTK